MCDWARTNYAAQYNLLGAIGAGIGVEFESERKQTFCSKFACMAYQNIGHSVVDNPSIATPSDISKSGHLYRIDKYLVKIEKEDEDSEPNQNERQKALINAFMMNVREIAGKNVQTFNDVDQIVLENRELDKPISDLLVQSGYLNMWQWDVEICPFHYDLDNLGAHVKKWGFTKEDLMDYCADQIKACDENERRYANNLAVCEDLMSKRPRQFIRLKINLYNTLIRQTEIRKEVAEKGSQLVIE
ncbi:MAG: hypothetical protein JWO30_839 [Fibrobacteres bacterium]|nr:hypothetical protein [Fibrobacterota bacterium]